MTDRRSMTQWLAREASTRSAALLRIALVLLLWTRFAAELTLVATPSVPLSLAFFAAIGRPELKDDPRFATVAAREVVRFAAGGASDGVPEAVRVGASRGDPGGDGVLAADLVRRWLPLSEVLLARAGEAVPDELVPDGLGG